MPRTKYRTVYVTVTAAVDEEYPEPNTGVVTSVSTITGSTIPAPSITNVADSPTIWTEESQVIVTIKPTLALGPSSDSNSVPTNPSTVIVEVPSRISTLPGTIGFSVPTSLIQSIPNITASSTFQPFTPGQYRAIRTTLVPTNSPSAAASSIGMGMMGDNQISGASTSIKVAGNEFGLGLVALLMSIGFIRQ